jgi:hypothetical protein
MNGYWIRWMLFTNNGRYSTIADDIHLMRTIITIQQLIFDPEKRYSSMMVQLRTRDDNQPLRMMIGRHKSFSADKFSKKLIQLPMGCLHEKSILLFH